MAFLIVDNEGPARRSADEAPKRAPYLAERRSPAQLLRAAGRQVQSEAKTNG